MSRPIPPTYKTRNWPACNEAFKRRGSLTIWFDPEMNWDATPTVRRGRQRTYSDAAIQTCLSTRVLFGMALTLINNFIETLNAALALLPEWATGEGGVRIGLLDPVELGRIGNPFEGAATAAGAAAADAFSAALSRTYLEPPDFGPGAMPTTPAPGPTAIAKRLACWLTLPVGRWPVGRS